MPAHLARLFAGGGGEDAKDRQENASQKIGPVAFGEAPANIKNLVLSRIYLARGIFPVLFFFSPIPLCAYPHAKLKGKVQFV